MRPDRRSDGDVVSVDEEMVGAHSAHPGVVVFTVGADQSTVREHKEIGWAAQDGIAHQDVLITDGAVDDGSFALGIHVLKIVGGGVIDPAESPGPEMYIAAIAV